MSRNGNLLLNFPLPGSGALDERELAVLSSLTDWMAVNGEGIYATRPWRVFGEGPSVMPPPERQGQLGFNEGRRRDLTPEDVRFTVKGRTLYAFVMGWPQGPVRIKALAAKTAQPVNVRNVEMLGHKGKLKWVQGDTELTVDMPPEKPCEHAVALKVVTA